MVIKTVIVTGASRGIGAAICRNLRAQGIRVIGVARSSDALQRIAAEKIGSGPAMEVVVGDVGNPEVVKKTINLATSPANGVLEALVLNAGILGPVNPVATSNIDGFRACLEVNTIANLGWIQAALPHLRSHHGRIILTSSIVSVNPYAGFSAYCVSKAALNMLTSVVAKEEPDVTFLAVEPGIVDTNLLNEFQEKGTQFMTPEQVNFMKNIRRDGNLSLPEDVAGAYAKLALKAPQSASGKFISWKESWVSEL